MVNVKFKMGLNIMFILFLKIALTNSQSHEFLIFKEQMQNVALTISHEMEKLYAQRCEESMATCESKSYNACLGSSQKVCIDNFPKAVGCLNEGSYVPTMSTIKFPPNVVNFNDLSQQQKQFVCTSAVLEATFAQLAAKRGKNFGNMYFGSNLGLFRNYPGNIRGENGKCDEYDPRYRPWYTIATSGTKNVIILIDNSKSMSQGDKINIAEAAAKNVVDTLGIGDNIGVIKFNTVAQYIGSDTLKKATSTYKAELTSKIQNLQPFGNTNFEAAFRSGLEMVRKAQMNEDTVSCIQAENVFLFLTDGEPTLGATDVNELISIIDSYKQNYNISIILFTYPLGPSAKIEDLLKLSCRYRGIMVPVQQIGSHSEMAAKMRDYYLYLSIGVTFTKPVWTEPYIDFFGYGKMVTVSMPAYYTEFGSNVSKILGVTGVDIVMSRFSEFGDSEENIINYLIGESACQRNNLNQCELQLLRGEYKCQNSCEPPQINKSNCSNYTNDIFIPIESQDRNLCCGVTIAVFVIILVVCLFVFILIVILICNRKRIKEFCHRAKKAQQNKKKKKSSKDSLPPSSNNYNKGHRRIPSIQSLPPPSATNLQEKPYRKKSLNDYPPSYKFDFSKAKNLEQL